jgi:hypothetical protein
MSRELASDEKQGSKRPKLVDQVMDKQRPVGPSGDVAGVLSLQRTAGNQAVQRLLAQRSEDGSFDLDQATTQRINQARGGGQPLDQAVQTQLSQAMGHDFSAVRVHTSAEADQLNQQLSAKAFTTGQDIFFKEGTYSPGTSTGNELLAHELTHVVQQSSGRVGGSSSGMTVRPAGDVFEQEADNVAKQATNAAQSTAGQTLSAGVQRVEAMPEDEAMLKRDETLQRQDAPEEEEMMLKRDEAVQRQDVPEEEEMMLKRDEAVQRQDAPEEEEMMLKRDETLQRQDAPEEEEMMLKRGRS